MSSSAAILGAFAPKMAITTSFNNNYLTNVCSLALTEAVTAGVPSYAAALAASQASRLVATSSTPDNLIKLYVFNAATDSLSFDRDLRGHGDQVHDLVWSNGGNPDPAPNGNNLLISASADGVAAVWDVRTREAAPQLTARLPAFEPLFSADLLGTALAVGGKPSVAVFDTRYPRAPVGQCTDVHTDEVTQVRFHPARPGYLLTGSEDTFINCFDLEQMVNGDSLDDCLDNTLPTEQPVAKMGFFGPDNGFLYAISPASTVTLWNIDECELVSQFNTIRDDVNAVICATAKFDNDELYVFILIFYFITSML